MRKLSALIVDGQHLSEDGEGLLVEHIARRRFSHVVRLPYFPRTRRRWTLTWFAGHTTLYRKAGIASLEKREQSHYYRLAVAESFAQHATDLLVLSTCYSHGWKDYGQPKHVITYDGSLSANDGLIFAAAMIPPLTRSARSGGWSESTLMQIFSHATQLTTYPYKWHLN